MRRIGVITPIKHLKGVQELIKNKGFVFYYESGSKSETRNFIIENKIDAILCNPNKQDFVIDRELLQDTQVKLINTCSTGLSHIDLDYCLKNDIEIYSLKTDFELINDLPSTSELAFGLMLNSLRHISKSQDHVINYNWDYTQFIGRQIKDLKIGIIGYGRLGKLMYKYCKAFDAEVKVYDPYIKGYDKVSLNSFISDCDVISLHVHLNDETKEMISKNSLKDCKPDITIINTSRGGVVNEEDVVSFLQKRKLYCYATDVITDENLNIKNSILIKNMERLNIIITPHVGGMTIEGQTKAYTWAINKL